MIEEAVHNGSMCCDESGLGQNMQREGHTIEIDQDLIDGVNIMLDYIRAASSGPDNRVGVEFRVELDGYFATPPVPVFGTVDAAIFDMRAKLLEIVDYKNGAGVAVSVAENPQLLFYAAGVLRQLSPNERACVAKIRLTIVQPNAGGPPVRFWEIDVVDLLMWVDEVLVPGVEACAQDDAPLNPGSWCRFCPVSHACPKLMSDAIEMAKREFDDIPDQPDELARALDAAERAELWITRLREFAVDQLQHQVRIPGWGLVPTRSTRKWTLPEGDLAHRLGELGAGADEIWETRVRSPAQLEKTLHRTRKGRLIWDQAAVMIEARSSGVKLGRDGTTHAKEDFNDEDGG
jgi:hypothetical protein